MGILDCLCRNRNYPFLFPIPFISAYLIASNGVRFTVTSVARFALYVVTIEVILETSETIYIKWSSSSFVDIIKSLSLGVKEIVISVVALFLLKYLKERIFDINILPLAVAHLLFHHCKLSLNTGAGAALAPTIGYGAGMACSYVEGYLSIVLPDDGVKYRGIGDLIDKFEAVHHVNVPVRRMFIVVTKSMFCPHNLEQFNKNESLPSLSVSKSLEDIVRDMAGVKDRVYRNSIYQIVVPGERSPVYLVVECATPMGTLYKVKQKRSLYGELAKADFDSIVDEFRVTLKNILEGMEYRDSAVIVDFDDTDRSQNLASTLLEKIKEINPDYLKTTRE